MQKFGLVLLFIIPTLSFADTVHFASANITSQDSIMGYGVGYTGVIKGKYAVALGYSSASKDDRSVTEVAGGFNYGFQSFDTGTVYLGLGIADIDAPATTIRASTYDTTLDSSGVSGYATIGYAKLSGEGLDYNFSLTAMDGETSVGASARGAIDDSDWGWQLGIASDGDDAAVSAGVSLVF